MRQGNLRRGCGSQRGRHARHDLVLDVCLAERFDLLTGTAEDHRISGFQANDAKTRVGESNHQEVDLLLLDLFLAASFSNVVELRARRNQLQDVGRYEFVVQNGIGGLQKPQSFDRQQVWIAGSRTYQKDFPFHIRSPCVVSSAARSRCSAMAALAASLLASECSRSSLRSLSTSLARISLLVSPSSATHAAYPGPNCFSRP